ncbi:MAG TPA: hypothetical protein VNF27_09825 [Candidatus Binataceae bacterium]|nr:hypothetical protein [Candidatus Binataceae bacterium]
MTAPRSINIPPRFLRVEFNGARHPGAPNLRGLAHGANCQHFAYELLRHYGLAVPDFRSSHLWRDRRFTRRVVRLRPLDLLLFNRTRRARGAHVAVYLGQRRAIHLSKQVGTPAIWTLDEFAAQPRYRVFLGAKRVALSARAFPDRGRRKS